MELEHCQSINSIYLLYNEEHPCAVNTISCDINLNWENWLTPIDQTFLENVVFPYIIDQEKGEVFEKRLEELLKSNAKCIESILQIDNIDIQYYIISAFSTKSYSNLGEESVEKIKNYLQKEYGRSHCKAQYCTTSTEVLTNYLTHFSTNITHAEYLVELLNEGDFDKDARIRAINQFIDSVKDHKPVDNRVFDKYASLLDYDDSRHSLLQIFGNACASYDYVPSIDTLAKYGELLSNNELKEDEAFNVHILINKSLKNVLLSDDELREEIYNQVIRYVNLLYNKARGISIDLLNIVINKFNKDAVRYGELIEVIIENEARIGSDALSEVVRGAEKLIKTGSETNIFRGAYTLNRAYKQDNEILSDLAKDRVISELRNIEESGGEKVKRVCTKLISELNKKDELEIRTEDLDDFKENKSDEELSSDLREEIKEAINKAKIDYSKLRISEEKVQGEIKYLYEKLGWKEESIRKYLERLQNTEEQEDLIRGLELIYEYNLKVELIDREGNNPIDILTEGEKGSLGEGIVRLYKDNNIYYPKNSEQIIKNIEKENEGYDLSSYIREQLVKIKKIEEELEKEIDFSYAEEIVDNQLNNKWYLYSIDGKVFLKGLDYKDKVFNKDISIKLSEIEIEQLKNVLLYQQPYHPDNIESVKLSHDKVRLSEFKHTEVNEDSIEEKVVWLKKAMHLTVLEKKYQVRDAQIISLLNLYKGKGGRLLQVSTGEGKTIIIAMFAALNVANNKSVDIITSSQVLAKENAEEQEEFYGILNITSAHNIIDSGGAKECYKSEVVYGDLLHFIGDDLRDIFDNVKYGRGYDIVITDEVDNMFVDNTNMKVQLSAELPGFHYLRGLKIYSWIGFKTKLLLYEQLGNGKWYLKGKEELIGREEELKDYLSRIDEIYRAGLIFDEESGNYYYEDDDKEVLIGDQEALDLLIGEKIRDYQEAYIKYNDEDKNYSYKEDRKEIGDDDKFIRYIKKIIEEYITNDLLSLDQGSQNRLVNIPRHLDGFMKGHSSQLVDSIIAAHEYRIGVNYKISNSDWNQLKISPVDYANTGVVQLSLTWSDGLHQYLELKHGLNVRAESLTNIFRSYVGYFLKYEGNIYGLTGTLGEEKHHKYLSDVYKVDTKLMPNYVEKNLERYKAVIVTNKEDWIEEVSNQAMRKGEYSKRGVLVICKTINEVNDIYTRINTSEYKGRVFRYFDSGYFSEDEETVKGLIKGEIKVKAGDIIVATNLAGRGTDLKITKEVNKNGGLHVILSYYPESIRVQEQAFGRGARNGDYGSAGLIILSEDKQLDIEELGKKRDDYESKKLDIDKEKSIPSIRRQDELFDKFVKLVSKVNSPTGYEIVKGYPLLGFTAKNGDIYVDSDAESREGLIHIKCYKPENTGWLSKIEEREVSKEVSEIDQKSYKHLLDTLTYKERSFNQRDSELIHYFASEMGCIEKAQEIKSRVDRKYCKSIAFNQEFEVLYEKYCEKIEGFRKPREEISQERMRELELERHKERFKIWERDRSLYNHKHEVAQLKENWAMWLKEAGTFGPGGLFGWEESEQEEKIEKLNAKFEEFAKKQYELFKNDTDHTNSDNCETGSCNIKKKKEYAEKKLLIKNPSYLVQKSRDYISKHYNKEVTEDNNHKRDSFSSCKEEECSSCIMVAQPFCTVQRMIEDAVDFAKRAISLDIKFSWSGYNMLALTKLIRDGESITDYEDADRAARVKQELYIDLVNTTNSLESFIISKQSHECGALVISQVVNKTSDTIMQCFFNLAAYEKLAKSFEEKRDMIAKVDGDEMIRVSRFYGAEEIIGKVNATDLEKSFEMVIEPIEAKKQREVLETRFNEKNITKEEYETGLKEIKRETFIRIGLTGRDNLFTEANQTAFKALTEDLSRDLNLLGFIGYDLEVYELEKDWTDTIIAGILSIATLAIGIVMLPAGGFLGVMGTSLIAQSVLELVHIGISISEGIPVDLDQFVKSKGIGVAVAIVTAGIAKGLESSGIVAAENIAGFQGLKEGVSKAAFIREGIQSALKMSAIMGAVDSTSKYIAKKYMEKNDGSIERDIEKAVEMLLSEHSEEITKILLNDEFNSKFKGRAADQEIRKIVNEALKIISDYASQGTARQIASGVTGKVSSFFGPIPGAIANLADAAIGYNKANEAVDELKDRLKRKIEELAKGVKATKELMEEKLLQDFPRDDAEFIMAGISEAGLLINEGKDIDYDHCERYKEIGEKSKKNIVGECEYIAGLREDAKKSKEKLKKSLVEGSLAPIRGIFTREVTMPIVRGELVDPSLGESLRSGKFTFRGGLIAEGINKAIVYFKNDQVKTKINNWETIDRDERLRKQVDALNEQEGQETFTGSGMNEYVCDGTICIAVQDKSSLKSKEWNELTIAKDESVNGIYGGQASQEQLKEFLDRNPYIAARDIKRDENGNIIFLDIRPEEKILVPNEVHEKHTARRVEQQKTNPTKLETEPISIPTAGVTDEKTATPKKTQETPNICSASDATCKVDTTVKFSEQSSKKSTEEGNIKKLTVNQKLVFADAGYYEEEEAKNTLKKGGEENSKVIYVFTDKKQGSNGVIIENGRGVLSYNVAGTHPPTWDKDDIREFVKDLPTDTRILFNSLDGDLKYRTYEIISNIEKYNKETGNNQPLILNGHSAGGPPAFFAGLLRPDLIREVNKVDSPGVYKMALELYNGDTKKAQEAYKNVNIYNANKNLINSVGDHAPGKMAYNINADKHAADKIRKSYEKMGSTQILARCYTSLCNYKNGEYTVRVQNDKFATEASVAEYYGVRDDQVKLTYESTYMSTGIFGGDIGKEKIFKITEIKDYNE